MKRKISIFTTFSIIVLTVGFIGLPYVEAFKMSMSAFLAEAIFTTGWVPSMLSVR